MPSARENWYCDMDSFTRIRRIGDSILPHLTFSLDLRAVEEVRYTSSVTLHGGYTAFAVFAVADTALIYNFQRFPYWTEHHLLMSLLCRLSWIVFVYRDKCDICMISS